MKIPEPKRLPSGNWNIRMRLNGQELSITRATASECKKEAAYIKSAHRAQKIKITPTDERILCEVVQSYIDHCKIQNLSPSTIGGYDNILRNRFKAYTKKRVKDIVWQDMIDDELQNFSVKTVRNAWGLVSPALKYAKIAVPESLSFGKKKKTERQFLDAEDQLPRFLKAITGHPYEMEMLLGLHSLRMSEILGLTWQNVNLTENTLKVDGAVVNDGHGNMVYKKENKTDTSSRTIPIMIHRLAELLSQQKKSSGFVTTITHSMLARALNTTCKNNDLPIINTHGLRHTFASLCYAQDVPILVTMRLGGWSNPQVVTEIYTHLSRQTVKKHERVLTDYFKNQYDTAPKAMRYKLKTPMKLPISSQKH